MALITKIPESIGDDSILAIDEFLVERQVVTGTDTAGFRFSVGTKIRIIGSGNIYTNSARTSSVGKNVTVSNEAQEYYFGLDVTKFAVKSKYSILTFKIVNGEARNYKVKYDFKYDSTIFYIRLVYAADLNIEALSGKPLLAILNACGSNVTGNIGNMAASNALNEVYCVATNMEGTMADFGTKFKNLTSLDIHGSYGITGTASDFEAAARAAGRNSGTCIVHDAANTTTTINFGS